jgi:riboflavin kinase
MLKKSTKWDMVFFLLRNGGAWHPFAISTVELANELGISQQSASRWLCELEGESLVERSPHGLKLSKYCMERLRTLHAILQGVFEQGRPLCVEGTAVKGVGDGKYYLSMPEYRRQVKERLGFAPFPGTLNIALSEPAKKARLLDARGIELEGFFREGRMLGAAKCFRCVINGRRKGAAIIPMRSHYGSGVLEIIAPANLRKTLKIRNGSRVKVEIEPPE